MGVTATARRFYLSLDEAEGTDVWPGDVLMFERDTYSWRAVTCADLCQPDPWPGDEDYRWE